jgi:FMN phosphatase YigB (HAD superfamily)
MDYKKIRVVGFDLDQTLYPKSPEIDEAIQKYIYAEIAKKKRCSLENARELFYSYYPRCSGSKTLVELGFEKTIAKNIVQTALENAEISKFLVPDPKTIGLLKKLKEKYYLSLLTGSNEKIAIDKLKKLEIPLEIFDYASFGEVSKSDGTAFIRQMEFFAKRDSSLKPENYLYVGDRKATDVEVPVSLGMYAVLVNVTTKDLSLDVPQLHSLSEIRGLLLC